MLLAIVALDARDIANVLFKLVSARVNLGMLRNMLLSDIYWLLLLLPLREPTW